MRALALDNVQPGLKLGKTLFSGDGRILLHRGTELSEKYLSNLRELGFTAIYVQDPALADAPPPPEIVTEQTRTQAALAVKEAFSSLKSGNGHRFKQDWAVRRAITNAAASIVTEISSSKNLCFQVMELRARDGYTFAHSVNVCIMGMVLARHLEVPHNKLIDLAIGLLIHDIGKILLPEELRYPVGEMSDADRKVYESHCEGGFGLLRDMESTFGATSRIVALQHHEKWDGSGFPRKLQGNAIHEYAQICAIVDTYDNLVARPHDGKTTLPHEALEYLMGACGTHFRLSLVQSFLQIVAPYPIGTMVRLNTGEKGIVLRMEPGLPQRPVLRLVSGERFAYEELPLATHPDRVVVGVVVEE